jgi:tetratricopeptide (TPR) repeat protein
MTCTGDTLIARPNFQMIATVFVVAVLACVAGAQSYSVEPDASKSTQPQTGQSQSPGQLLGWGSNIQNARLARAAELALQHGDKALALDYAQRASQATPNDPQLWFLLGYAARLKTRFQESVDAYSRGLHLAPSAIDGLSGLGQTDSQMGRTEDAEHLLKQVVASDWRRRDDALLLGELYMKSGDYTDALDWLGRAERSQPSARSELLMALTYQHLNQLDSASLYLEMAKRRDPNNPDVQRSMAGYYRGAGNYPDAIAALQSIRMPKPDALAELAYTYQLNGKLNECAVLYARAANAAPKDLGLQLAAAQAEIANGSVEQANPFLSRAAGLRPDYYRLHAIRGEIANFKEREQDAAREYTSALANLPAEPPEGPLFGIQLHMDLMNVYRNLADEDAARQQLDESQTEINALGDKVSGRAQFLRLRALIKMNAGDFDSALGDMKEALAINAHDRDDLQLDGDILMKLDRIEDAIAVYKQILALDPVNRFALTSLGYASRAAGRDQDAEKYFPESDLGEIYVSTGKALNTLGDHVAAMERFRKALAEPGSDRVSARLAIAQLMAEQGHSEDSERQIALAQMEGEAGATAPPTGSQFIAAADVLRSMHEYQLSQAYLQRAKAAGAQDSEVRIGFADNYLALGDTVRAQAELSAVKAADGAAPDYQYLLAEANVYRQEHHSAQALTSLAQAADAEGEDQSAEQDLLQAGEDGGLIVTPALSVLSDLLVEPISEDSTVYVPDSKLDASFPVPSSDSALLPPPRSSIETQSTNVFHLNIGYLPTVSGFFQVRNAQGQISVPGTNSIIIRNTTDYIFNVGLNPSITFGNNVLTFNSGVQTTVRRDSESPVDMDQSLFRIFIYMSTSSFFNAVSVRGYVIRETGPFTESKLHSLATAAAVDFRVGSPWGKTALVTGWGANDQQFSPVNYEAYYTSSYIGIERKSGVRLNLKATAEDVRAWRIVGSNWGNAQNLRPAGTVDFTPNHSWDMQLSTAYSSTRNFHVYDAIQNGFSLSYARPFRRKFNDDSRAVVLAYPIRLSAGIRQESFFNFRGGQNQQFRPYVRINLF